MEEKTDPLAKGKISSGDGSPGPLVTPELFREWRSPRRGQANPERMNNPVWEWLVYSKCTAFQATKRMAGPSAFHAGPGWCFDRFGQSTTQLPDGRVIFIAGEHEDHYDPDFYIYNDVVVCQPDGKIDIFGYPETVFPPTDFHSSTLADSRIILVGNLGYSRQRQPRQTPIYSLDLLNFSIAALVTTNGISPGWLSKHEAILADDGRSILIRGGMIESDSDDRSLAENVEDWRLHLHDWRWEKLTARFWKQFEIRRRDRKPHHLWEMQHAAWERSRHRSKEFEKARERLRQACGIDPDLDMVERFYRPSLAHVAVPSAKDEYRVHRIMVCDTIVRMVEDWRSVRVIIEGDLDQSMVDAINLELVEKLATLENVSCEYKRL
jgi:hypothetical protein